MDEDQITLARRHSGGGAVFQDLGNSCFTFLSSNTDYNVERNLGIIANALKADFGINAVISGRNDMTVDGCKISGSAFKKTLDRTFHHGTLLLDVDINALGKYLTPNKAKLQSKGVDSVKARVMNLREIIPSISHELACQAIVRQFFETYGNTCPIQDLDKTKLEKIPALTQYYKELQDWNWRYGRSPSAATSLETRFPWGIMDVEIKTEKGKMVEVFISSDSLFPLMVDELMVHLKGQPYSSEGIHEACSKVAQKMESTGCEDYVREFCVWLASNI